MLVRRGKNGYRSEGELLGAKTEGLSAFFETEKSGKWATTKEMRAGVGHGRGSDLLRSTSDAVIKVSTFLALLHLLSQCACFHFHIIHSNSGGLSLPSRAIIFGSQPAGVNTAFHNGQPRRQGARRRHQCRQSSMCLRVRVSSRNDSARHIARLAISQRTIAEPHVIAFRASVASSICPTATMQHIARTAPPSTSNICKQLSLR